MKIVKILYFEALEDFIFLHEEKNGFLQEVGIGPLVTLIKLIHQYFKCFKAGI